MDVPRRLEDAREGLNIRSWLSVYQRDRSGGVYHMHADSGSEAGLGNASRLSHLALDPGTLLRPLPLGGVNWLDLERVEDRYLLAASSDASVLLYDTQGQEEEAAGQVPPGQGPALPGLAPLLSLTKASPGGHRFSVSSAAWYPLDNGLFVTGGYDCQVKVWDANTPALADSFSLDSRVHCLALSAVPGAHCLTAAGCEDPAIQLCDLASGARLHSLAGHRAPVLALAWSPAAAWQLLSGAADGSLRVWDVRRAGASLALALARDPDALFLPSGSAVLGYDLRSGAALCTLRGGHHEAVHACVWSEAGGGTLYTGGADRLVLTWRPRAGRGEDEEDAWSE
ncbi:DNA excision repair protein ERCC-8 [Auxenochlorella protothecoides]|uniref:DNA excision repair protein ERCC-8 n=1 Tax=Auxenochlorella protothecoides TaxID=3075 RepID=A0A087SCI8_AUXPR|nr:DNA excision repair protein ERCC-8 [Auxenochlorella protothecoides]KFM23442.1 DNA excision repair protein ERCC-8 [Auxenochlorella protothecoides]